MSSFPSHDPASNFFDGDYAVSTTNKGITFRGSPYNESANPLTGNDDTDYGYIMLPASGGNGGFANNDPNNDHRNIITQDVLDEHPDAQNNTIFNREEIKITIKYRVNAFASDDDNRGRVSLTLMDGNGLTDELSNEYINSNFFESDYDSGIDTSDNYFGPNQLANTPKVIFPIIHHVRANRS